ncbi:TetR/AcrR family transcriptional regulator [Actinokineospora iranica]|uniref:DNA-binding transcriptional regulator, AcrR family n=1 Tax=Actinokineospora iranica TaxID=1271860 RepID=A0A1G6RWN4_9PSEU|nr:TetR/AcrR family transcriptional regulator [Actinokineospora iranica]SDD08978.1 DNA-binding transcriptional regulator, AcrR family [Actinokineospora iranica]
MPETTERRRRAPRGEGGRLREQIVDAAARLLADTGDEGAVSIRAVADAVGVTPPSIYRHFEDKSALLQAVLDRLFGDMEAALADAAEHEPSPVRKVLAHARAYLDYGLLEPGRYKVLYEGRVLPTLSTPDTTALDTTPGRTVLTASVEALREAMRAGETPDADPWRLAVVIWQILHGVVSMRINKPRFPWAPAWEDAEFAIRSVLRLS